MPRAKTAGSRPAADAIATAGSAIAGSPPKASAAGVSHTRTKEAQVTATGEGSKPEAPAPVAKQVAAAVKGHRTDFAGLQPAANAADRNRPHTAGSAGAAAANFGTRTTEPRVAAASPAAAPGTTAVTASAPKANHQANNNVDAFKRPQTPVPGYAEKVAAASPGATDVMVVLLMTRPEIKSVSDLANQNVAIDYWQSASTESVRTAIAAAGATGVQLSKVQTDAINLLINGEERAAVLTLMSPEAAKGFPDIAGFSIFRIPLAPASPKAAL
jgi:hypothetical protein